MDAAVVAEEVAWAVVAAVCRDPHPPQVDPLRLAVPRQRLLVPRVELPGPRLPRDQADPDLRPGLPRASAPVAGPVQLILPDRQLGLVAVLRV